VDKAQTTGHIPEDDAHAGDLADLRAEDFDYLDAGGHTYLDHTGAGLPPTSLVRGSAARITGGLFGNPHSESPASRASGELLSQARRAVLRHFNADPAEYAVIFTANATGALRLVGEAYPFTRRSRLVMSLDNHNSVNGLREYARSRGATTAYVPVSGPGLRMDEQRLRAALPARERGPRLGRGPGPGGAAPAGARTACSPTRHRATSPASSTRSPGSRRPRHAATTSCSTPPRTYRPTPST
jgi:hypothetical protein